MASLKGELSQCTRKVQDLEQDKVRDFGQGGPQGHGCFHARASALQQDLEQDMVSLSSRCGVTVLRHALTVEGRRAGCWARRTCIKGHGWARDPRRALARRRTGDGAAAAAGRRAGGGPAAAPRRHGQGVRAWGLGLGHHKERRPPFAARSRVLAFPRQSSMEGVRRAGASGDARWCACCLVRAASCWVVADHQPAAVGARDAGAAGRPGDRAGAPPLLPASFTRAAGFFL